MAVMFHKPAQIDEACRTCTDINYIKTYNGRAFFQKFHKNYECNPDIFEIYNKNNNGI